MKKSLLFSTLSQMQSDRGGSFCWPDGGGSFCWPDGGGFSVSQRLGSLSFDIVLSLIFIFYYCVWLCMMCVHKCECAWRSEDNFRSWFSFSCGFQGLSSGLQVCVVKCFYLLNYIPGPLFMIDNHKAWDQHCRGLEET